MSTTPKKDKPPLISRIPKITRDGVLFAAGLAGFAHETVADSGERPSLLIAFGAMCGLPAFFRLDEARQKATANAVATAVASQQAATQQQPTAQEEKKS